MVSPALDRVDVDTDQIIPKQFLKRVERTGFGEFLFYDWIRDGEIELEPEPDTGRRDATSAAARRASTLPGRSRTTASGRSSPRPTPTSFTTTAPRWACSRRILDGADCRGVAEAGEARIDVDDDHTCAAGVFEFGRSNPDVKRRLLNGLDDIGITLENAAAIDAFESSGSGERGPVTTAL